MRNFYLAAAIIVLFTACSKGAGNGGSNNSMCDRVAKTKVVSAKTTYYEGEEIRVTPSDNPDGYYYWYHSNVNGLLGSLRSGYSVTASKQWEGWFHLVINNQDCKTHYDSLYIKVTAKPGTAPCNPVNNKVTFSSIPNISFPNAATGIDPVYNRRFLEGYQSSGYPNVFVYFHSYWNNVEPEDGEYDISQEAWYTNPSGNYKLAIITRYQGLMFQPSGGKAYVSHVNGKLQVTFCDITMTGNGYSITATGKLTAP